MGFIKKEFPENSMNEYCSPIADRAWNDMLARCPSGGVKALPAPSEIEKLVCEVATQKQVEDKAIDEICAAIKKESPHNPINAFCHNMVERAWDDIVARCPKGDMKALPTPGEVENLVCKVATQKQVEDKAIDEICASIKKESPHNPINAFCHNMAERAWDDIVARCRKGDKEAVP